MTTLTLPLLPLVLLNLIGFLLSAGLFTHLHHTWFLWLIPIIGASIYMGAKRPDLMAPITLVLLPLLGFLNLILKTPPISLVMLIFLSSLLGHGCQAQRDHHRTVTIHLPKSVLIFFLYLIVSAAISLFSYFPWFPNLHSIVAHPPWGAIPLINALGWIGVAFLTAASGIVFFIWLLNKEGATSPLLRSLFLGMTIASIVGLLQYVGWRQLAGANHFFQFSFPQFNATFNHPNTASLSAALLIPVWLGYMSVNKKKYFFWLVGPALLFLVFISGSRSAMFLSVLSCIFVAFASLRRNKWILIVLLSLILFGTGVFSHLNRFFGTPSRYAVITQNAIRLFRGEIDAVGFLGDRIDLWKAGWVVFKNNPVVGVGLGNYLIKMPAYNSEIPTPVNDNCGNMYLHIAAEQGIIGLSLFLFVLGSSFFFFIKTRVKNSNVVDWGAVSALLALLFAFVFGAHLLSFEVNFLFWFLLFILYGPKRVDRARS